MILQWYKLSKTGLTGVPTPSPDPYLENKLQEIIYEVNEHTDRYNILRILVGLK